MVLSAWILSVGPKNHADEQTLDRVKDACQIQILCNLSDRPSSTGSCRPGRTRLQPWGRQAGAHPAQTTGCELLLLSENKIKKKAYDLTGNPEEARKSRDNQQHTVIDQEARNQTQTLLTHTHRHKQTFQNSLDHITHPLSNHPHVHFHCCFLEPWLFEINSTKSNPWHQMWVRT